jgi:hypothetical protein
MTRSGRSTGVTDTVMSSDATPHTATAWPVPGEPTLCSVTWLPGRALTRDQAITAITIAEIVTATRMRRRAPRAGGCTSNRRRPNSG